MLDRSPCLLFMEKFVWRIGLVLLFILCKTLVHAQDVSWLHLADEIQPDSRFIELRDTEFVFQNSQDSEFKVKAIVRWGRWPGIVGHQAVWLSDGSWLSGKILSIDDKSVWLQSRWLEFGSIPWRAVRAVVYTPAASLQEWAGLIDQLDDLKGDHDTVWLRDGSRLTGVADLTQTGTPSVGASPAADTNLTAGANPTARATSLAGELTLEVGQEHLNIPWERVATFATSPTLFGSPRSDDPSIVIGLEDGSRLLVSRYSCKPDRVELEIVSLGKIRSLDTPRGFSKAIRFLECDEVPQVERLDTLQPTSYRFIPDSELIFELGVNRSVFDRPIMIGERSEAGMVSHALAMHSSSQLAYRWDQSPGKFLAEVCLANLLSGASGVGDSVCKVLLGRDRDFTIGTQFALSRKDRPLVHRQVEVDITGAQLVVLVVEKGRFGQWGDQVYWLDPRFYRN